MELTALRFHYGIGAIEAQHEIPAWEREMLIRNLPAMLGVESEGSTPPRADPFSSVPDELMRLPLSMN